MRIADIPALRDAPLASKLELIEELWAEITAASGSMPLPDWHVAELDRSLADYKVSPREGRPWSEVRDDLLGNR